MNDGTLKTLTPGTIASTTNVTSSGPTVFGEPVTITATVQGSASNTINGGVMFLDGATTLGFANVTDDGSGTGRGIATFTTSSLTAGPHSLTATYGGGTNYAKSPVSDTFLQTVNLASTTTDLSLASATSTFGMPQSFTATVNVVDPGAGQPSGAVTFMDGSTPLGTAALGGFFGTEATFTTTALSAGSHTSLTAVYGGDANFDVSTSPPQSMSVSQASTTTTVTSSSTNNTSTYGQSVTFTATVNGSNGGTATGLVTFSDGGVSIGTGSVSGSNVATFSTTTLPATTHTIKAVYGGDSNLLASNGGSGSVLQTVNKASTTTTATSSSTNNTSTYGQSVTFTATVNGVNGGTATGIVTFSDGGVSIGTGSVSGNVATFSTTTLPAITHTIKAVYGGDTNLIASGSGSGSVVQTVNQASTTTTVTSSSTNNTSTYGQSVTFTASVNGVNGGTATGVVTFSDGGASLGTGSVIGSNVATFSTTTLPATTHTITAVYGGDTNLIASGSGSGSVVQTVNKASTTTTVTAATPSSPTYGTPVTFTATVANTVPGITGTVTFSDGSTSIGTGSVSGAHGDVQHLGDATVGRDAHDQGQLQRRRQLQRQQHHHWHLTGDGQQGEHHDHGDGGDAQFLGLRHGGDVHGHGHQFARWRNRHCDLQRRQRLHRHRVGQRRHGDVHHYGDATVARHAYHQGQLRRRHQLQRQPRLGHFPTDRHCRHRYHHGDIVSQHVNLRRRCHLQRHRHREHRQRDA